MTPVVLSVRHLSAHYGRREVFRDLLEQIADAESVFGADLDDVGETQP